MGCADKMLGMLNHLIDRASLNQKPETEQSPCKAEDDKMNGYSMSAGMAFSLQSEFDQESCAAVDDADEALMLFDCWEMLADPWIMLEDMCDGKYLADYTNFMTEQVIDITDWRPLSGDSLVQLKYRKRCETDEVIKKFRMLGSEFTFELLVSKKLAEPGLVVEIIDEECAKLIGFGGQSFTSASNTVVCRDGAGNVWTDTAEHPTTDHRGDRCYGMVKFPDLPVRVVGYSEYGDYVPGAPE